MIFCLDPGKTKLRNEPFCLPPERVFIPLPWRAPSECPFPLLCTLQTGADKLEVEGERG